MRDPYTVLGVPRSASEKELKSAYRKLAANRRACFDNTALLWHYTVAQGVAGTCLLHGFPRWVG